MSCTTVEPVQERSVGMTMPTPLPARLGASTNVWQSAVLARHEVTPEDLAVPR